MHVRIGCPRCVQPLGLDFLDTSCCRLFVLHLVAVASTVSRLSFSHPLAKAAHQAGFAGCRSDTDWNQHRIRNGFPPPLQMANLRGRIAVTAKGYNPGRL